MKPRISQLAQSGAANNDVITWNNALQQWVPAAPPGASPPLLSDALDGSPVVADGGTDWLYPN